MNLIESALYGPSANGLDIYEIMSWILRYGFSILIIVSCVSRLYGDTMIMTLMREGRRHFWRKFILKCIVASVICTGAFTACDFLTQIWKEDIHLLNIIFNSFINLINFFAVSTVLIVLEIYFGKKVSFIMFYIISTLSAVLKSTDEICASWLPGCYGMVRNYFSYSNSWLYINILIQILTLTTICICSDRIIEYRLEHPEKITK